MWYWNVNVFREVLSWKWKTVILIHWSQEHDNLSLQMHRKKSLHMLSSFEGKWEMDDLDARSSKGDALLHGRKSQQMPAVKAVCNQGERLGEIPVNGYPIQYPGWKWRTHIWHVWSQRGAERRDWNFQTSGFYGGYHFWRDILLDTCKIDAESNAINISRHCEDESKISQSKLIKVSWTDQSDTNGHVAFPDTVPLTAPRLPAIPTVPSQAWKAKSQWWSVLNAWFFLFKSINNFSQILKRFWTSENWTAKTSSEKSRSHKVTTANPGNLA